MSRAAYSCATCRTCKKDVTMAGAARVAHMRKHVREGFLVEGRDSAGFVTFEKNKLMPQINFDR